MPSHTRVSNEQNAFFTNSRRHCVGRECCVFFLNNRFTKKKTRLLPQKHTYPLCVLYFTRICSTNTRKLKKSKKTKNKKRTLICKKSLISKVIAQPCIGESSSFLPSNATFVRTANATGFVCKKKKKIFSKRR